VLLVDDDSDFPQLLRATLKPEQYDLLTATSARAVQAIVQLAKGEGIDTVAEFVETPAIARKLRALGVDYGQGNAFGKPEPLDSVLAGVRAEVLHRAVR